MALTRPFAQNGEKSPIPQTSQDGTVSYEQGFGILYTLTPEEGGKYIDREQFNQILYDTTLAVIENQNSIGTLNDKVADIESSVSTGVVNLTGNQTIQGVKTFRSPVVIPNGAANNHAVNLGQLNTKANANATVNLSGTQTIAGNKTFSGATTLNGTLVSNAQVTFNNNAPVSNIAPTVANHLTTKAYVDGRTSRYITQTYSGGTSWYRIWSDKWCEQGGYLGDVVFSGKEIMLLQPYRDTSFTVVTALKAISNAVGLRVAINSQSTLTFSRAGNVSVTGWWKTSGYIA